MSSDTKLFIHIPKNGGMTLRHSKALRGVILVAKRTLHKPGHAAAVDAKMKETKDHPGFEHARWIDISEKVTKNHQAFAIVRNPWDRVVSRYFFAKKVIEVEKKVPKSYADISSFEAFLEERHKWGNEPYMWHRAVRGWYPALDYMVNEKNEIVVDVLRFENYNEDVFKYFNLKQMTEARNVTGLNKKPYTEIYTPNTIQIVADWYAKDIDTFGYDFDTGPTRNYYFERKENE